MRVLIILAIIAAALTSYYLTSGTLDLRERGALLILIISAGLWITEAVPLAATALLIPILQSLLGIQRFGDSLRPFFDPIVMLLFGGFLLAIALEKYNLDEYFAYTILSRVKADKRILLLAIMLATTSLSLWISNTAAAAIMMAVAMRLIEGVADERDNFPKALVLGIAFTATIGGVGTLVGTTTTAMAAGALKRLTGIEITFMGWLLYGLPIAYLMTLISWLLLLIKFPIKVGEPLKLEYHKKPLDKRQWLTLAVFGVSILLWLTERLPEPLIAVTHWSGHGLSSGVVAAIISVFLLSSLLNERDLLRVDWGILLLIGGGMSLGEALEVSGLMSRMGEALLILTRGTSPILIVFLVSYFGIAVTAIASNTASAAILLPIAISIGLSTGVSPATLAIIIGITSTLDFMLPVGTPPNAIALSTGKVSLRELIKAGLILDLLGGLITSILAVSVWPLIS